MRSSINKNEKELLLRLRDGDTIAFEELYDHYKEPLARKLYRILKSWDETQEILQELFVRIWENRRNIKPELSIAAYLHTIATRLTAEYFRKLAHDRELAERLWLHVFRDYDPQDFHRQILADQELMNTIDKLPLQRKTVFTLCKLEGKSYKEVSHMLSISEAAVNDHITKANKFLIRNYDRTIPLLLAIILCNR
ncbi:sigma-70 family RNA polymerase sigma factor [Chryseobacterium sp. G0240]|uniref:RNA polymerase sigma factor n=1 Tax=Chryseobacterium sp. G0240 TaxID=2487066 RepID=UPI000F4499DB|nr:sigma-70 family RNA polymerase sigma factor [Chryseobacterium sp. G0240]ROI02521.1 sigma-70 family RNA polymerase sigma factor [Chryseobacterium sp. G0240]